MWMIRPQEFSPTTETVVYKTDEVIGVLNHMSVRNLDKQV